MVLHLVTNIRNKGCYDFNAWLIMSKSRYEMLPIPLYAVEKHSPFQRSPAILPLHLQLVSWFKFLISLYLCYPCYSSISSSSDHPLFKKHMHLIQDSMFFLNGSWSASRVSSVSCLILHSTKSGPKGFLLFIATIPWVSALFISVFVWHFLICT